MSDLSPFSLSTGLVAALVLLMLLTGSAAGQLISPGKLSQPHAQLEGIRSCTQCHQLREAGVSRTLCLDCHSPLARRIESGKGYHADVDADCATCHKEHFGLDFALVRFDTAAFRHESVGYRLEGAHGQAECRDCHTPRLISDPVVRAADGTLALDRTFLGLPSACVSCHVQDDPHGNQFAGRACSDCHDSESWERAPGFDHDQARYRLTGRHAAVECAECHRAPPANVASVAPRAGQPPRAAAVSPRYRPVRFDACSACHVDPHEGAMQGRCESCHTTAGWQSVDRAGMERRFDHERTGFELMGSHAQLTCASCHDARTVSGLAGIRIQYVRGTAARAYPSPVTGKCVSCHLDEHSGQLEDVPGGAECTNCHGEVEWLPAHYGPERHSETTFPLEGAHRTVACADCHRSATDSLVFSVAAAACTDCHQPDDPHDGQFSNRSCDSCHSVQAFRIPAFDHGATRYPLDGAHRDVSCSSCHAAQPGSRGQAMVRYRPLGTRCVDCHAGVRG